MEPEFKVIIVGGSIAGLTLANCLDHLGVDYVVLEKRKEIAPQEGASIVLMPHAGRILEQLGLIDEISKFIEPLHTAHVSYPDGFQQTDKAPQVLLERFGIPLAFLERRKLLQILYGSLPDQSRVLVDKTVTSVQQSEDDIGVVKVQDGSIYRGDLIVGADGVHSRVRREMWRLAELKHAGQITKEEKDGMTVDYVCVFGISNAVPNLRPGEQVTGYQYGRSLLVFPGQNGRVYWFLFKRLDRQYEYHSAPRWSPRDATKIAKEFALDDVWAGLSFNQIWINREVVGITNLEENVFSTWHHGRVVCIGDSMHKFAPNTGQGANSAIEDAATLANCIHKAIRMGQNTVHPSYHTLQSILRSFDQSQVKRAQVISRSARLVVRLSTGDSLLLRLVGRFVLPYIGDIRSDVASRIIAGGVLLSFLEPSQCSGPGWQDFRRNPESRSSYSAIIVALGLATCLAAWMIGSGLLWS